MQPLEDRVFAALTSDSPATDAGPRVYPVIAEQGASLPRITFARVSTAPQGTLDSNGGNDQVRVQVDCWASTAAGAYSLAQQVRGAMEQQDFKARMQNQFADFETDTKTHRYSLDFRCWDHLS